MEETHGDSDCDSAGSNEQCAVEVESQLSSRFTLLLDPNDDDREDDAVAYDGGEYDDRLPPPCPGCGVAFRGTSEKGRKAFLSTHIRLHNLQARRALLCSPTEVTGAATILSRRALEDIVAMEGDGTALRRVQAIAQTLLQSPSTEAFFAFVVGEIANIMDLAKPIFLTQERHDTVNPLHGLIMDEEFRRKCLGYLSKLAAGLEGQSQFLGSFFMRVKDQCALFRLSKMRERLPPPSMAHSDDRLENVLYISGWVLWKTKRTCWKNIKKEKNTIIFQCIKTRFSEGGEFADKITDPKVRKWIDAKNRGEVVNGKRINGLTVPSETAFQFFSRLDAHVETFESRHGLQAKLTQEALLSKVYDDLQLLDLWGKLVSGIEEAVQQQLLEFVSNVYRKLVGNAVAKRMVRGLFKRSTVATRTNLKRNPAGKPSSTSTNKKSRNP